jgi:glyoxylase-like metal-dependent hydrolase (beta-lactamase superfamily II)
MKDILTLVVALGMAPVAMSQELALEEVAPGTYAVLSPPGHLAAANAGVVLLEDAVLVVDTHMVPSAARELLTKLSSVTDLPVRYVVNAHWHPDHTHGNEAYRTAFPGDVIFLAHDTTRADIAIWGVERLARDRRDLEESPLRAELRGLNLVLPNLTFSQSLRIAGRSRVVQILYFGRGHTRGDAVVYLPRERVAFVGDLVPGGPPFARDGFPMDWIETLRGLHELDIDVLVTGHGRIWRGKRVLSDRVRFLEHVAAVVRKGASESLSAEQIAAAIDLEAFRDTFEPEPAHRPWKDWMFMLAERGLLELKVRASAR